MVKSFFSMETNALTRRSMHLYVVCLVNLRVVGDPHKQSASLAQRNQGPVVQSSVLD